MKAKRWILAKQFTGEISQENIKLEEFELPDQLNDGEILLQAVYLSVDPYMRFFPNTVGNPMIGEQVAEVLKTKNGKFPIGSLVLSKAGWQTHSISKGDDVNPISFDMGSTPISYALGTLGLTGATAFLSLKHSEAKANETVLISSCAGSVGSTAGQIAKQKGCKVIGICGGETKAKWCKDELGFDHVIDYKKENFSDALSKIAPEGVDVFIDLVGGDYYHTVVDKHMKHFGRVMVVGTIQTLNDSEPRKFIGTNLSILSSEITVKGFIVYSHFQEWQEAFIGINKLIQKGKLKVKEHVYVGFDKMRDAFFGLFKGEGIGKSIVKAVNVQTNYP